MSFKRILFPTDFSAGAEAAFAMAQTLARESNAMLVIAHVWSPTAIVGGMMLETPAVVEAVVDQAEEQLAKAKERARDAGVKEVGRVLLTGSPWQAIVDAAANDPTFDLIVIGTRGRTGLKHALLGSVAENVVRRASCPVLVVRAPELLS
jgi:nucleotide-binding universal stress UspA family protein